MPGSYGAQQPSGQTQQPYADPQNPYGQQSAYGQGGSYGQSPYGQQQGYGMQPYSGLSPKEENTWASAAHWTGPVAALITGGVLGWLGPLIVMLTQGPKSPRVRAAAVEALNFQITVAIGVIISYILMGVVIGIVLLPLIALASIIFSIMGAVAENQGRPYKYPFSIKIVK